MTSPTITALSVYPVAGRDSMALNLAITGECGGGERVRTRLCGGWHVSTISMGTDTTRSPRA